MTTPPSDADLTPDDHPEPDGSLPPDSKLTVDPAHEAIEEPGGFDPELPDDAD